jgi:hypothetical protein
MNIRAKCSNRECSGFGVEKSVTVGQMLGYGAAHGRVTCPCCGNLMTTTETINASSKNRSKALPRNRNAKRIRKRMPKRS